MADLSAIVLAAGKSRRFGADKLLQPLRLHGITQPLAVHSLQPWLAVFPEVTVVTGTESDALRQVLGSCGNAIRWVNCENAEQGMGHSLSTGIAANVLASGWLIGLADMPAVSHAAIAGVRDAIEQGLSLAAPYYQGRRGHPVGFSATYLDELLALQGDQGAREILQRDSARLARIEVDDRGIFYDIDTLDDMETLELQESMP